MKRLRSLAVVVPTYCCGLSFWTGLSELLRWHHKGVDRFRVVIVDDGSPLCAFREGQVTLGDIEIVIIVNRENMGQSNASLCGFQHSDTEWTIFIEDDLIDWVNTVEALVNSVDTDLDLVNVARGKGTNWAGPVRAAIQPIVRFLFFLGGLQGLADPTSPIKAVRTSAFQQSELSQWSEHLMEGLAFLAKRSKEIRIRDLSWDSSPTRYSSFGLFRLAITLGGKIVGWRFKGSKKREAKALARR